VNNNNKQGGRSLIELPIATVIVGILFALANGGYTNVVDRSNMTRAVAELGQITLAINQYALANDDQLPANLDTLVVPLVDPWGNSYQYSPTGSPLPPASSGDDVRAARDPRYGLFSVGPDGAADASGAAGPAVNLQATTP
jgi:type II secretory pathway pseudopilin PulG